MSTDTDFRENVMRAVEDAVLKKISDGSWMSFDYKNRVAVETPQLRAVYDAVDMDAVGGRLKIRLEAFIADKIFNAMATEVTTDIKRILSNTELREDLRSIFRAKIREVAEAAADTREE